MATIKKKEVGLRKKSKSLLYNLLLSQESKKQNEIIDSMYDVVYMQWHILNVIIKEYESCKSLIPMGFNVLARTTKTDILSHMGAVSDINTRKISQLSTDDLSLKKAIQVYQQITKELTEIIMEQRLDMFHFIRAYIDSNCVMPLSFIDSISAARKYEHESILDIQKWVNQYEKEMMLI